MKKWIPYLPGITALLGCGAAALRLWLNSTLDDQGLLADVMAPRVLLMMVTILAGAVVLLPCLPMAGGGKYSLKAFSALPGVIGMAIGAVLVGISSVASLLGAHEAMETLTAVLGMIATTALLLTVRARICREKVGLLLPGMVCAFLILHLLSGFRTWGGYPQVDRYLFQLLAGICLMLAQYQMAALCCDKGNQRLYTITHLGALYFCIGALPGSGDVLFYLGAAVWVGTNAVIRRKR